MFVFGVITADATPARHVEAVSAAWVSPGSATIARTTPTKEGDFMGRWGPRDVSDPVAGNRIRKPLPLGLIQGAPLGFQHDTRRTAKLRQTFVCEPLPRVASLRFLVLI